MTTTNEHYIQTIKERLGTYQPSSEAIERIGKVSLILVTGPAGVGKNTVMAASSLPRVISDTTREPRINNGKPEEHGVEYYFRGNDLRSVLEDVEYGNFVQVELGANKRTFYGTKQSSYPGQGPAIIDVLTPAVPKMQQLPFERVVPTQIVVPYQQWLQRLNTRGKLSFEDYKARIEEAETSIKDALDGKYDLIVNTELAKAAEMLLRVANGEHNGAAQAAAQKIASNNLRELRLNS